MWSLETDKAGISKVELLSPRARRGLGLIALALTATVVAGLVYLHPNQSPKPSNSSPAPSPLPVSRPGDDVFYDFITPSMGWALVASPKQFSVFRTVDGAKHWLEQLTDSQGVPAGITANSVVKFFDKSNGVIVLPNVSDVVYRTIDGGAHWQLVVLPGATGAVASFSDPTHGWVLVPASFTDHTINLYGTTDGGSTWQRLPDPPADVCMPEPVSCTQLTFVSALIQQVPAPDGLGRAFARRVAITFRGTSEGWIGGRANPRPHVYSSSDGGRSWNRHDLPTPAYGLASGAFASVHLLPGTGVVASLDGGNGPDYPLTSFDGGGSWSFVSSPPTYGPAVVGFISFQDDLNWWVTDGSILFKSSDAGLTWSLSTQVLAGLLSCQFLDSKHAWGLFQGIDQSAGQGLASTADGGLHWTQASVPDPA